VSYRVVFAPEARDDLRNLYDFIADRAGGQRALTYIEGIERFCLSFRDFPERGIPRDDLFPGLRVVGYRRRVALAFHVDGQTVVFDRVLYGGRDLRLAFGSAD
jgi:toxin ParE1/3/4